SGKWRNFAARSGRDAFFPFDRRRAPCPCDPVSSTVPATATPPGFLPRMFFASDNWAGAHPSVAANLSRHAAGFMSAYGSSDLDRQVERTFCDVFEREVAVFFVGTG